MSWPWHGLTLSLLEDIQTWAPLITALAALEAASCYDPTSESWPCSLKLYGETTRIYVSLERHANYDAINDIIWHYHTWENMEDSITVHIIYLEIKWNECNLNGKRADYLEVRVALPCPNRPNQLKVCGLYCDTGLSNGYFTKKTQKSWTFASMVYALYDLYDPLCCFYVILMKSQLPRLQHRCSSLGSTHGRRGTGLVGKNFRIPHGFSTSFCMFTLG